MNAWDVQAGIQRDFDFLGLSKLGETSFWGGYEQINDGLSSVSIGGVFPANGKNFGGIPADRFLSANTIIGVDVPTEITGSQVSRWSLALDQAIDSANMHLYAVYQHLTPTWICDAGFICLRSQRVRDVWKVAAGRCAARRLRSVYTGGRINFNENSPLSRGLYSQESPRCIDRETWARGWPRREPLANKPSSP